ncbi:MAG: peptidylprolyl isomerase [Desulfosarcinaceae bacterium]|nr:peptidylprolyl isomerase [Desulfosarcinaceae bacterium]
MKLIRLVLLLSLVIAVAPAWAAGQTAGPQVKLETTLGDILITLNTEKAPATVANFLAYVRAGHYDGTIFHRVIKGFMIQGGGFDAQMRQKATQAPIANEADNGLLNVSGSIAMARTRDPHSATAQFFINTVDNDFLNHRAKDAKGWGYCVFGSVSDGMAVVRRIEQVATGRQGMHRDVPEPAVMIRKATIVE